jgi:transposase InsO family protein
MDLVGPARVRSTGGKWYVLVVVDDYSRYVGVFFLEEKWEMFGFVRDLVLRLRNERHGYAIRAIRSDNGSNSITLASKPFAMTWVLYISFRVCILLPRMAWWNGKIEPCVRW